MDTQLREETRNSEDRMRLVRWERLRAALGLLLVLAAAYAPVLTGGSIVFSSNFNPLDYRPLPANYGEGFVPWSTWQRLNQTPYVNQHDPGGAWWQWEPAAIFLRQAVRDGEWPFWDPYVAGGAPAMGNLTPTFFYPPYLLMVMLEHRV